MTPKPSDHRNQPALESPASRIARAELLELLSRYRPIDQQDAETLASFLGFVDAHPDCLERSCEIGHITASAWLLSPCRENVLLTHHRKLGAWLQLGGHLEGESRVQDGALREAREESGIEGIELLSGEILDLDIHLIPERKSEPAHHHYDVRFLLRAPSADFQASEESENLAWVPLEKIESFNCSRSVLRMRDKCVSMFPKIR